MGLPLAMIFLRSISRPIRNSNRIKPSCAIVSTLAGSVTCFSPSGPTMTPASRNAAMLGIFSRVKITPSAPAASRLMPMSWTSDGMSPPAAHAAGEISDRPNSGSKVRNMGPGARPRRQLISGSSPQIV